MQRGTLVDSIRKMSRHQGQIAQGIGKDGRNMQVTSWTEEQAEREEERRNGSGATGGKRCTRQDKCGSKNEGRRAGRKAERQRPSGICKRRVREGTEKERESEKAEAALMAGSCAAALAEQPGKAYE